MSDETSPPETDPTLFEWAGGYPALLRMTRIFYGQYVADDPLLAPLFADMSPDHPERVAAWLSEVFGGPSSYTERFGDYDRMVRGDYLRIGEEPGAREEAGEAGAFYGERISGAFSQAGTSVADIGEQLGEWLKRTRERAGGDDRAGDETKDSSEGGG